MEQATLLKQKKRGSLKQMLLAGKNIETLSEKLKQDPKYRKKLTMIIDLENVFLDKIDLYDPNDYDKFSHSQSISEEYIILKKTDVENPKECRKDGCPGKIIGGFCLCHLIVYNIRPHTFQIIGAMKPFFEMIAISNLPFKYLKRIID
jgi:hypothetical protein